MFQNKLTSHSEFGATASSHTLGHSDMAPGPSEMLIFYGTYKTNRHVQPLSQFCKNGTHWPQSIPAPGRFYGHQGAPHHTSSIITLLPTLQHHSVAKLFHHNVTICLNSLELTTRKHADRTRSASQVDDSFHGTRRKIRTPRHRNISWCYGVALATLTDVSTQAREPLLPPSLAKAATEQETIINEGPIPRPCLHP